MNPSNDEQVVYFAETDARNKRLKFGIKKKDRSRHMYAIGKTGMGKSTLLENLAVQDIMNGDGLAFIDPHGKSADLLLEYVPKERIKDVIYFAPFDMDYPISFNVMEDVGPEKRYLVASGLMAAFKKIWVDAWSARMEYILGNIMLALLEYPGSTLIGVNRMLTDKDFRKEVVSKITDPSVRSFWVNEYASYTDKFAAEAAPAIQNKVGQFVANPLIRNIIGQAKSSFDIRTIMEEKKILIINLSKGRVGEANANLLGSMLITKIYLGAMSRADLSEKELEKAPNFYLYVDEFQSFANESFADILSEARKYKLNLTIAHQYIEQMTEEVRAAVFGNVGSMCVFRVGAYDAEVLEKEFAPQFTAEDIVNLQKYQMYLKLMIDGVTSPPFSASGMSPIPKPEINYARDIIDASRAAYAKPRQDIEDEIQKWHEIKFGQGGGGSGGNSSGGGSAGGQSGSGSMRSRGPQSGGQNSPQNRGQNNAQNTPNRAPNNYVGNNRAPGTNNASTASIGQNRPLNDGSRSAVAPSSGATNMSANTASNTSANKVPNSNPNPSSNPQIQSLTQDLHNTQNRAQTQIPVRQNRPANVGGISHRPEDIKRKNDADNARENAFRKAISLNYLKPETEKSETKVDSKAPKPENVAALREALLSVMNAGSGQTIGEAISEKVNANNDIGANTENNEGYKNVEYKKHNPSHSISNETLSDRIDKIENKERARHSAETARSTQDAQMAHDTQVAQNKHSTQHGSTHTTESNPHHSKSNTTSHETFVEPSREIPKLTVSEEELKKLFEME